MFKIGINTRLNYDEGQHEANRGDAEQIGLTAIKCIEDAGESLGFRIRMSGSFKVGQTWAETH